MRFHDQPLFLNDALPDGKAEVFSKISTRSSELSRPPAMLASPSPGPDFFKRSNRWISPGQNNAAYTAWRRPMDDHYDQYDQIVKKLSQSGRQQDSLSGREKRMRPFATGTGIVYNAIKSLI
jgi:hypothetical protein